MAIGRRTIIPKVHEPNNVSITPAAASFAEQTPPAPHPEVDDAEAHNPASDAASAKEDDVLKMQEPSLQPAGDRGDEARENNAIEVPQPPGRHFMDVKNLREGDNGFGRRPVAPRPCDPLPEDTEKAEQLGENSDFTAPVCEITFFDRIQRIASPIVILLGAILGIYVFGNLASFWRQFCAFSWLEKICFGIPMAVFAGIVFYMLYRLVCLWIKLRTFTQISSKALHELQGRSELRELSRRRNQEARGKLEELLRTDTATQDDFIKKIAPKELENIQKTRETLLDDTHCSAKDWIDLYVKHYQSKLDEVA